jgi:hypothetical protein
MARIGKRAVVSASNPLSNRGTLQTVLSYVGPGHWFFLSAVCSEWKELYESLAAVNVTAFTTSGSRKRLKCEPRMTLASAVFQSSRRVRLAHHHGWRFVNRLMQQVAGKVAGIRALAAAHKLGMPYSPAVLLGAAERGSTAVLKWLHINQSRPLPPDITVNAARGGSVNVLRWLHEMGSTLSTKTLFTAAKYRRLNVLNFLDSAGCPKSDRGDACRVAAQLGNLQVLQWLREHNCPWQPVDVVDAAAQSGNVQMMAWLLQPEQPDVELTAAAMRAAARANRQDMCEYLYSQDCPWSEGVCSAAADAGHLQLLLWLHEHGCPWNLFGIRLTLLREGTLT